MRLFSLAQTEGADMLEAAACAQHFLYMVRCLAVTKKEEKKKKQRGKKKKKKEEDGKQRESDEEKNTLATKFGGEGLVFFCLKKYIFG